MSTHFLLPSTVLAQKQLLLPLQFSVVPGVDVQIGVLPLQGFLLLASAGDAENKGMSALPKSAPAVSLMALPREMVPEASSLDRSSKEGTLSKRGIRPSPLQFSSAPNNCGASFFGVFPALPGF